MQAKAPANIRAQMEVVGVFPAYQALRNTNKCTAFTGVGCGAGTHAKTPANIQ